MTESGKDNSPPDGALYYRAHIFCCTNKRAPGHERGCCADKGSERLRNYMKKRAKDMGLEDVRVNTAGCLDRCELGPCIVIYPEGIWYAPKNEADIDEILAVHLQNGGRVERLMLPSPPRGERAKKLKLSLLAKL